MKLHKEKIIMKIIVFSIKKELLRIIVNELAFQIGIILI